MPLNQSVDIAMQRAKRQALSQRSAAEAAIIAHPRVQFADWLSRAMPQVWEIAEASAHAQSQALAQRAGIAITGLGAWGDWFGTETTTATPAGETTSETKSVWEKLLDGAIAGGTAYLSLKNQKDMLALNIERAKAGLPPLDAAATAPVIRTEVSLDPALARDLLSDVGSSINRNLLIAAAVGLVALLFFMRR